MDVSQIDNEGIVVISLFDGMSCLRLALEAAGIKVAKYFASEIDKPAITIAKKNYPDTIHIGDVTKVRYENGILYTENGDFEIDHFDLIAGGSPCQGFSFAGKQLNFKDPRSMLFFEFVRLKKETNAANFLLENVVMKKEFQVVINDLLGVEPVFINSSLVSAQNRKRLYWSNTKNHTQPNDRGILLKHILLKEVDIKYLHSKKALDYMSREVSGGRSHWDFKHHSDSDNDKSACLTAVIAKGVPYNVLIDRTYAKIITSNQGVCINVGMANDIKGIDQWRRVYSPEGKCPTLVTCQGGHQEPKVCTDEIRYRKLTPVECERLQTAPDNYTEGVSDSQRYKMLGNGWTIDVIVHILNEFQFQKSSTTKIAA